MLDILSSAPYFLIILIVFSALYHGIKHRSRDSIKDPSGQLVRRIYFYTLTLISILMIAFGVVQTSTFILEGIFGESLTGAPPERAAIGISLIRSEEHTSELQSLVNLVCRLMLKKKKKNTSATHALDLDHILSR